MTSARTIPADAARHARQGHDGPWPSSHFSARGQPSDRIARAYLRDWTGTAPASPHSFTSSSGSAGTAERYPSGTSRDCASAGSRKMRSWLADPGRTSRSWPKASQNGRRTHGSAEQQVEMALSRLQIPADAHYGQTVRRLATPCAAGARLVDGAAACSCSMSRPTTSTSSRSDGSRSSCASGRDPVVRDPRSGVPAAAGDADRRGGSRTAHWLAGRLRHVSRAERGVARGGGSTAGARSTRSWRRRRRGFAGG